MMSRVINDPLGSPLILMDEDGNIVKRYRFDPWGNIEAQWGTEPNRYLFTGKEKDENGLYYFGARYYNPRLGRFVTPDPEPRVPGKRLLENPQLMNPYAYCINNPFRFIDPDGRIVTPLPPLRKDPTFMEALISIPFYPKLHAIKEYEVGITKGIPEYWYGRFELILLRKTKEGEWVPYKARVEISPDILKSPAILRAVLYKELFHAIFTYKTKGEIAGDPSKWRAAEEIVGATKMLKYVQKKGLKLPKWFIEEVKVFIEKEKKYTTEEYIKVIEERAERYGL